MRRSISIDESSSCTPRDFLSNSDIVTTLAFLSCSFGKLKEWNWKSAEAHMRLVLPKQTKRHERKISSACHWARGISSNRHVTTKVSLSRFSVAIICSFIQLWVVHVRGLRCFSFIAYLSSTRVCFLYPKRKSTLGNMIAERAFESIHPGRFQMRLLSWNICLSPHNGRERSQPKEETKSFMIFLLPSEEAFASVKEKKPKESEIRARLMMTMMTMISRSSCFPSAQTFVFFFYLPLLDLSRRTMTSPPELWIAPSRTNKKTLPWDIKHRSARLCFGFCFSEILKDENRRRVETKIGLSFSWLRSKKKKRQTRRVHGQSRGWLDFNVIGRENPAEPPLWFFSNKPWACKNSTLPFAFESELNMNLDCLAFVDCGCCNVLAFVTRPGNGTFPSSSSPFTVDQRRNTKEVNADAPEITLSTFSQTAAKRLRLCVWFFRPNWNFQSRSWLIRARYLVTICVATSPWRVLKTFCLVVDATNSFDAFCVV